MLDILPAVFGGPFFTAVFFDPNSKQTQAFFFAGLIFVVTSLIIAVGLPKDVRNTSNPVSCLWFLGCLRGCFWLQAEELASAVEHQRGKHPTKQEGEKEGEKQGELVERDASSLALP